MAYFPFYIDIKDRKILVVGGGKVALRKVEKLLSFEPKITVIAPFICEEIRKLDVAVIERKFIDSDLDNIFCAISATDDEGVNGHIFKLCSEKNILVNTVDDKDKCGFIFPALVNKNGITAGITSSGKSPVYAKYIRERLEELLDGDNADITETLFKYRKHIKSEVRNEADRKIVFERLLALCLSRDEINDNLVSKLIEEANNEN
ncbi:bifunctional precorrin-2 dehydrogenase/sirohydrochlorin ferrochelatase [Candidatus Pseudoruminococcus sp.]|uniref:precorrin-2 dehydrogenase/sirohydrochlorin ferrochelatase family protein n=1 Tax=Candidatus Pseudoruminococcus sp. TaxID=3101048 RepID=UPI003999DB80